MSEESKIMSEESQEQIPENPLLQVARVIFTVLDKDYDEKLNFSEFLDFAKKLWDDTSAEEKIIENAREILELADKDEDDCLNLKEWEDLMDSWDYEGKLEFMETCRLQSLIANAQSHIPSHDLLEEQRSIIAINIFKFLDTDQTDTVDFTELTILADALKLDQVSDLLKQLDMNNDGQVSLDEWLEELMDQKWLNHAHFFETMLSYDKRLRAARVMAVKEKAKKIKFEAAIVERQELIRQLLQDAESKLSFKVQMANPEFAIVTFSEQSQTCPIPEVCLNSKFYFDTNGELTHFIFEEENFQHKSTATPLWNDAWVRSKLSFKASVARSMGNLSTTFMKQRGVGK
jgi:Ca2+-binding EF-hand superfamily protein